ncbi:MAG: hypothetical protein JO330_09845 [Mycobacteriaceae bacterium]|nr:hypothetical protein [Mycobacteriaceae bacterium]
MPIAPPTCCAAYGPRDPAAKTLRALATDLISEVRQLDRRITKAANDIQTSNIDQDKLRQLVESFNPEWWQKIATDRFDELGALDSVTAVRNSVSHGGESGITLLIVRQYFDQASMLLDDLSELFDPQ